MPALLPQDKPALLDERQSLKDAQAGWGGAIVVLSALAVVTGPVSVMPIAVAGVVIAALKRKQNAVERVLDDPPRADYTAQTRVGRRRYTPGALGDEPLAVAADWVVVEMLHVASCLEAAVRADERSQGAEQDGAVAYARWQLDTARWMLKRAKAAEATLAKRLDRLAIEWGAFAVANEHAALPAALSPDPPIHVPLDSQALIARTGLVGSDLDFSALQWPAAASPRRFAQRSVADVALDAAVQTRVLARSAAKVASPVVKLAASPAYEAALEARDRGDEDRAVGLLEDEVERGSPDAMFELALLRRTRDDLSGAGELLQEAARRTRDVSGTQTIDLPELQWQIDDLTWLGKPPPRLDGPGDD